MSTRHTYVTREIRPKGDGYPACDEYHDAQAAKQEEDEVVVIIGARGPLTPRVDIPGSVEVNCDECGHPAIFAPSGQELIRQEGATPLCHVCGFRKMREQEVVTADEIEGFDDNGKVKLQPLRPEQVDEVLGVSFKSRDPFA